MNDRKLKLVKSRCPNEGPFGQCELEEEHPGELCMVMMESMNHTSLKLAIEDPRPPTPPRGFTEVAD